MAEVCQFFKNLKLADIVLRFVEASTESWKFIFCLILKLFFGNN